MSKEELTIPDPISDDFLAGAWEATGLPPGFRAITTTRSQGSFGLAGAEPVGAVMDRWEALQRSLQLMGAERIAAARQTHGSTISLHLPGWSGWLCEQGVDGHVTEVGGMALAVTIADCTPVLIAHPAGAIAALHAGWRGLAAGILEQGLDKLTALGFQTEECTVYLGPAICGACYEVGPEVLSAVSGNNVTEKGHLDVRGELARRARRRGVTRIVSDDACTRCRRDVFFSHRGGDSGRQLAIIWMVSS